ncbi:MAG: hypothetical protein AAF408_11735 [Pseudomonadota bacterium]
MLLDCEDMLDRRAMFGLGVVAAAHVLGRRMGLGTGLPAGLR